MQNNTDMTSSHSEKEIYDGCIELMQSLTRQFHEWLDYMGIDTSNLSEDEQFCANFYPTEIVETLFLRGTSHSGGTSCRMKCNELGIKDYSDEVSFDFSEFNKEDE